MIKSMTGFASLTREDEQATIAVSIKTVTAGPAPTFSKLPVRQ